MQHSKDALTILINKPTYLLNFSKTWHDCEVVSLINLAERMDDNNMIS